MVDNGTVVNVILWDGESEFECEGDLIPLDDDATVGPGWTLEGDAWIAPPEEAVEPPMEDPVAVAAKEAAVRELTALGISEETARAVMGLQD